MNIEDYLRFKKIGQKLSAALKKHPIGNLLALALLLTVYAMIIFGASAIKDAPAPAAGGRLEIDRELYQRVLTGLKARATNIQQGIEQEYPDIFR